MVAPKFGTALMNTGFEKKVPFIADEYHVSPQEIAALSGLRELISTAGSNSIETSDVVEARKSEFEAGAASASAELQRSNGSLLPMDEVGEDLVSSAGAMGWNSVWAGEENSLRVKANSERA